MGEVDFAEVHEFLDPLEGGEFLVVDVEVLEFLELVEFDLFVGEGVLLDQGVGDPFVVLVV